MWLDVFKIHWSTRSKYDISFYSSIVNINVCVCLCVRAQEGGTYTTINEHENLQCHGEQDIHMNSKNYDESATASIWIGQPFHTNCVFHILGELG